MCFIATLWHTIFMYHRPDLSFLPSTPHVRRILLIECLCVDVWAVSVRTKKKVPSSALCCRRIVQTSSALSPPSAFSVCFVWCAAPPFAAFLRPHRCHCTQPAQRHRARIAQFSIGRRGLRPARSSSAAHCTTPIVAAQPVRRSDAGVCTGSRFVASSCCPDQISAR